jgi:hypothetical protein
MPLDLLALAKGINAWAKFPVKTMLVIFALAVTALFSPLPAKIKLDGVVADHPFIFWGAFLLSGFFLLLIALEIIGTAIHKPLRRAWTTHTMRRKMKHLALDEILVLKTYLDNGAAVRTHLDDGAAVMSLESKGILLKVEKPLYDNWLDRWTYFLTPEANDALRHPATLRNIRSRFPVTPPTT